MLSCASYIISLSKIISFEIQHMHSSDREPNGWKVSERREVKEEKESYIQGKMKRTKEEGEEGSGCGA